jgi:hypothetical protein
VCRGFPARGNAVVDNYPAINSVCSSPTMTQTLSVYSNFFSSHCRPKSPACDVLSKDNGFFALSKRVAIYPGGMQIKVMLHRAQIEMSRRILQVLTHERQKNWKKLGRLYKRINEDNLM